MGLARAVTRATTGPSWAVLSGGVKVRRAASNCGRTAIWGPGCPGLASHARGSSAVRAVRPGRPGSCPVGFVDCSLTANVPRPRHLLLKPDCVHCVFLPFLCLPTCPTYLFCGRGNGNSPRMGCRIPPPNCHQHGRRPPGLRRGYGPAIRTAFLGPCMCERCSRVGEEGGSPNVFPPRSGRINRTLPLRSR